MGTNFFDQLPDEIIRLIDDQLEQKDKKAFSSVSKRFYNIHFFKSSKTHLIKDKSNLIYEKMMTFAESKKKALFILISNPQAWLCLTTVLSIIIIPMIMVVTGFIFFNEIIVGAIILFGPFILGAIIYSLVALIVDSYNTYIENKFNAKEQIIKDAYEYGLENLTLQQRYNLTQGKHINLNNADETNGGHLVKKTRKNI